MAVRTEDGMGGTPDRQRFSEHKHTMLNRMTDENDLGGVLVFLLRNGTVYITGVILPVDGGYTAK